VKSTVFWVVRPCSSETAQIAKHAELLLFYGLAYSLALKMEVIL
jgi:hypothetical protein